jgi:hypothetical protein
MMEIREVKESEISDAVKLASISFTTPVDEGLIRSWLNGAGRKFLLLLDDSNAWSGGAMCAGDGDAYRAVGCFVIKSLRFTDFTDRALDLFKYYAKDLGFKKLRIETCQKDLMVINLYNHAGFEIISSLSGYSVDGDGFLMEVNLG